MKTFDEVKARIKELRASADLFEAIPDDTIRKTAHNAWLKDADQFLADLRTNFGGMSTERFSVQAAQVKALFTGMIDEDKVYLLDPVVLRIAVAKACISVYKFPFDTSKMKEFDTFANELKQLIMNPAEFTVTEMENYIPVEARSEKFYERFGAIR